MAELNQLEQVMRQPDAVMEPGILVKLRQYVAKGGSPRDVVEMLTDSYVGGPVPFLILISLLAAGIKNRKFKYAGPRSKVFLMLSWHFGRKGCCRDAHRQLCWWALSPCFFLDPPSIGWCQYLEVRIDRATLSLMLGWRLRGN